MAAKAVGGVTVGTMMGAGSGVGEGLGMLKKEQHEVRGGCELEEKWKWDGRRVT